MVSSIWNFFTKTTKNSVKCNKCAKLLKSGGGSTKTAWDHLKRCEPEQYAKHRPRERKKVAEEMARFSVIKRKLRKKLI